MAKQELAPVSERVDTTPPPMELCYGAESSSGTRPSMAVFQLFAMPLVVAAIMSVTISPNAGLGGLIGSAIIFVWLWKRKKTPDMVLRVESGSVVVLKRGKPRARYSLTELTNVRLDIKTIQRVQEGGSAIPAMRFIDSKVGPDLDTARIVLIGEDGKELPLTEDFLSHMDSSEWLGKIRVFLRKHGWVPGDER
jgi:hypothetical protein